MEEMEEPVQNSPGAQQVGQQLKVLIADDEASLRLLVAATLEDERFQITEAKDGTSALAMARAEHPDLVLLDVAMPGLDGLEVCRMIKQDPALAGTTVVMLTAKAQEVDRRRGLEAGADAYLTKPFSPLELLRLVEQIASSKSAAGTGDGAAGP